MIRILLNNAMTAGTIQHGLLNEVPGNDPGQAELWVAIK
jgi:hypothetical protein